MSDVRFSIEDTMNTRYLFVIFFAAVSLAGCGSSISRSSNIASNSGAISTSNQVSNITLSLTDKAREMALENQKFNFEMLQNRVWSALKSNSLINTDDDRPRRTLEIQVKSLRLRSNQTAGVFGLFAGADSVAADLIIKDPSGKELDRFEVSVFYALGGSAAGQDFERLAWLYDKFAQETIKGLTRQ